VKRIELAGEREVTAPGSVSRGGGSWTGAFRLARLDGALRISDAERVENGSGWVSGADGERQPIEAGEAVLWGQGEEHESGSDTGMTALVVEAESIDL
jgi:hypothetical protein